MYTQRKNIVTALIAGSTMILAVVGIFTAIRLYQLKDQGVAPNAPQSKLFAWDCSKYIYNVEKDGTVTIENGSDKTEPAQQVDIFIDNAKVKTIDVPGINPFTPKTTIGKVDVPVSGNFSWKAVGLLECQNEGSYSSALTSANCQVAFDESDRLYCTPNQTSVTVSGKAINVPANSTLQTAWYVVNPESQKTTQVYKTQPITSGQSFTVTGTWPGTTVAGANEVVEIHFGANILDSNGNPFPNCTDGLDYYWNNNIQNVCTPAPTPTKTPSPTPTATATATPTTSPTPTGTRVPEATSLPNMCVLEFSLTARTATPTTSPTSSPTTSPTSSPTATPTTTASATPTTTATATPTSTGTATPSATSTPKIATGTPRPTTTPVSLPAAGVSLPTLSMVLGGIVLAVLAVVIAL